MKKLTFVAVMAIAAVTLTSCGGASTPKANLKSDVDSLSYALGVNLGHQLLDYNMLDQMGVDSAFVSEFLKGVNEAANAKDDKKKQAYFAGLQIGSDLNNRIIPNMERQFFEGDSTMSINRNNLLAAFFEVLKGKSDMMTAEAADSLADSFQKKMKEVKFAEQIEAGKKFLEENAKKDSVLTTESGLQYKVIKQGTGATPTASDRVKVHYEGRLLDGTVFDSSLERGEPVTFGVGQVIAGWTEALQLMPVGSEYELYIPQNLGYGEREAGSIPPYSTLIFKVQLLDIEK
jgi:FKBP-type peptidyl-prolyl cis-trans isomerase FklB